MLTAEQEKQLADLQALKGAAGGAGGSRFGAPAAAGGVCLPEGFAERLGGASARRAIKALRRLAASSFRAGVMHGRALERLAAQAGQQEPES